MSRRDGSPAAVLFSPCLYISSRGRFVSGWPDVMGGGRYDRPAGGQDRRTDRAANRPAPVQGSLTLLRPFASVPAGRLPVVWHTLTAQRVSVAGSEQRPARGCPAGVVRPSPAPTRRTDQPNGGCSAENGGSHPRNGRAGDANERSAA